MRVLHINCNYITTALHQIMIENLDRLGHENRVFVPTYDRNLAIITPNDYVVVSECFRKWDRILFDYKQKKIRTALEQSCDVAQYDMIHAYTLFTDGNCARQMSKKYGIPYVVAVRNTDVNNFFKTMVHLRGRGVAIMRDAKYVFFLSEAYRKQVFDRYVPRRYHEELMKKTRIIPNGIDDFWFDNPPATLHQPEGGRVSLIYAGRIDRNKNIPTIQNAMKRLRDKGYDPHLTVVGKVADKRVFAAIQADPDTTCLSARPKEQLIELYRQHHIFVMPSFTESFGLVYAEAMSQGLPVVYSKGQGFDRQFPEGFVGYHVSAHDVQDVTDGIEAVIRQYTDIQKNVVAAAGAFRWTDIAARYDEIYRM